MNRRIVLNLMLQSAALLAFAKVGHAQAPIEGELYKDPSCTCCEAYAGYLEPLGFRLGIQSTLDLYALKRQLGVPLELNGCHTLITQGFVVEGHIPVDVLRRLFAERPLVTGIALPGMPVGVPGMPGPRTEQLTIYSFGPAGTQVYAVI